MTAQDRDYTATDYGVCRYILENRGLDGTVNGLRVAISDAGTALTIAYAKRLKRLNLIDGDELATADGEYVKLTGLGVKTAKEAQRLAIAATS